MSLHQSREISKAQTRVSRIVLHDAVALRQIIHYLLVMVLSGNIYF